MNSFPKARARAFNPNDSDERQHKEVILPRRPRPRTCAAATSIDASPSHELSRRVLYDRTEDPDDPVDSDFADGVSRRVLLSDLKTRYDLETLSNTTRTSQANRPEGTPVSITVQCPNPDCGSVLLVPTLRRYASLVPTRSVGTRSSSSASRRGKVASYAIGLPLVPTLRVGMPSSTLRVVFLCRAADHGPQSLQLRGSRVSALPDVYGRGLAPRVHKARDRSNPS